MVDCRDVVQSSTKRAVVFSRLFLLSKRKSWFPGIKLLSRLCLETRSSEFFARGRCSSPRVCFPRPSPSSPLHLFPFSSLFLSADRKDKASSQNCIHDVFLTTFRRRRRRRSKWNLGYFRRFRITIFRYILNFIDVLIRFNMLLNWLLKLMSSDGYGCHRH